MGFKIISTDINDFHLEVPSDWTATSQNGIIGATANGVSDDKSNISLMSTMLNGPQTAQEYFKLLLDSYLEMYDSLRITYSDKTYDIIPTPAEDEDTADTDAESGEAAAQADEGSDTTADTTADTSADTTADTSTDTSADTGVDTSEPESTVLTTKEAAEKYVEIDFGSEKAARYVFEAKVLGESYRFMQVLCIHGGRLYIFTYTSTEDYYQLHETEVEYIISYIKFKV